MKRDDRPRLDIDQEAWRLALIAAGFIHDVVLVPSGLDGYVKDVARRRHLEEPDMTVLVWVGVVVLLVALGLGIERYERIDAERRRDRHPSRRLRDELDRIDQDADG